MGYTSPRFTTGNYNRVKGSTPGPGSYAVAASDSRTLGSSYSGMSRHAAPMSTQERHLSFNPVGLTPNTRQTTPGAGAYSPRGAKRGMGDLEGRRDGAHDEVPWHGARA